MILNAINELALRFYINKWIFKNDESFDIVIMKKLAARRHKRGNLMIIKVMVTRFMKHAHYHVIACQTKIIISLSEFVELKIMFITSTNTEFKAFNDTFY